MSSPSFSAAIPELFSIAFGNLETSLEVACGVGKRLTLLDSSPEVFLYNTACLPCLEATV